MKGSTDVPKDEDKPKELTKKMLLKVIQRYHTDKNGHMGEEWQVLSEEVCNMYWKRAPSSNADLLSEQITKMLTQRSVTTIQLITFANYTCFPSASGMST